MSNIAVHSGGNGKADARKWAVDISGQKGRWNATLLMSTFTAGTHYPDGFLPTGIVLGKITSGGSAGLYGLYDDAATDGRQTAVGFLWTAFTPTGTNEAAAVWLGPGFIEEAKLPAAHGLDAEAKVELAAWFKFL